MSSFWQDLHLGRNIIRRVEVMETDDSDGFQKVTVEGLDGEIHKNVYRAQYFGSTGHVPKKSQGLLLMVGGRPDQGILIAIEDTDKREKNLAEGERCLYNAHGDKIFQYKEYTKVVTKKFEVSAEEIILDGVCYVGGKSGALPASRQGTLDSAGHAESSNFATKVYLK